MNKLRTILLFCTMLLAVTTQAQSPTAALLPMPNFVEVEEGEKPFRVSEKSAIGVATQHLDYELKYLQQILKKHFGKEIPVTPTYKADII